MSEINQQEVLTNMGADVVASTIDKNGNSLGEEAIKRELQKYSQEVTENL